MEKIDLLKEIEDKITRLSHRQKRHLLNSIKASLNAKKKKSHSLLELEGLGQEIWEKIDSDIYINLERNSWT